MNEVNSMNYSLNVVFAIYRLVLFRLDMIHVQIFLLYIVFKKSESRIFDININFILMYILYDAF